MRVYFQENGDVWYEIQLREYHLEVYRHIVDYPADLIEIDDIDSIFPVYKSSLPDGRTLIEIKQDPDHIDLKYVKKGFLTKEKNSEDKVIFRYRENINIDIAEDQTRFLLQIHSPYSYISAISKLSTAKFNNQFFAPGNLSSIFLKQSGTMEIDWTLEIVDVARELNEDKKKNYLNDHTQRSGVRKMDKYSDDPRQHEWLDVVTDKVVNRKSLNFSDVFDVYGVKDIAKGSCFYLSAGADITPIIALEGKVRTFILCDNYGNYPNSKSSIREIWSKIDAGLEDQHFKKLGSVEGNAKLLRIRDFHFRNGGRSVVENVSVTLWEKNEEISCLIYLNWDNSMAFHRLYVDNMIIPKAICELLPDGGSLGPYSAIRIPYRFRMPEYAIGHRYSLGKPEEYELVTDRVKYFGDFPTTYGNAGSINGINMYRRR